MGDPDVNVTAFESALETGSKKSKMLELSRALTLMGFGTWNNLEPEISRSQEGCVRNKPNETLFEKVQALEAKRVKLYKDQQSLAKLKKGGPQQRKQAEIEEEQLKKTANKKPLDEEQRAIHEHYQVLLNEFYTRKAFREKTFKTRKGSEDQEALLRKTAKLFMSNASASAGATKPTT